MSESASEPDLLIVSIPEPNSTEMVKLLSGQMDNLFNALGQMFKFTTGDVMSACLCHMIEAGQIGRQGDMDGLRQDILQSVEVAIAHYSAPDKEKRN